ncbi:hypothetical protein O181_067815 [Austropuccinia psidii MF-1]|uniref:Profilin n=1 Tax=Austropuccinia psidii MF-1 TaxID=1389203 RepID=A0A9Q3I6H6_9BASI|nr:hypothetical protein [Austropuccinia psidii MF-1]
MAFENFNRPLNTYRNPPLGLISLIMSWQTYVDSNLLGTGYFQHAAILGQAGGSWASSSNFSVSAQEQSDLLKGFDEPSTIQASGIHLASTKYLTIQANDRSIYGKKGPMGCVCVKTKQAIIVAVYKEGVQPGEATKCTESLADYLIGNGF